MRTERGGFSLVELVVALVILTMGMLAMAAGSTFAGIQVRGAGLRSQRTAAVAAAIEQIRASAYTTTGFDAIASLPQSSAIKVGRFSAWYDVGAPTPALPNLVNPNGVKRFIIHSQGPTYVSHKGWVTSSVEDVVFDLYRPVR